MLVKELKVRFGRTIYLGDFETVRIDAEEAVVLEGEDPKAAFDSLYKELRGRVDGRCREIKMFVKEYYERRGHDRAS